MELKPTLLFSTFGCDFLMLLRLLHPFNSKMNYSTKKIYYVPGAISLMLLLPLCYKFLNDENKSRAPHLLAVVWTNEKSLKRDSISNPESYSMSFSQKEKILRRNYLQVEFNGDDKLNIQKLEVAEQKILELNLKLDTINGVHFIFNSKTKYSSTVHVLNSLMKNRIPYY